jgi:DNA-binding transcriptional MerR regulator
MVDELAAAAGVPTRTIRFYQGKGLLPRPELRGRVAYYGAAHLERLKLVAELQDRGLQIKAICDLVARIDKGELAIQEWLGLEDQLQEPWANDRPRVVEAAELGELAGELRPGRIGELLRARLVERKGDAFLVRSPALLQLAVRLEAAGVDLETAEGAANILRKQLRRTAGELAEHFIARTGDRRGRRGESLGEVVRVLRPIALEAVRLIFAQEMERVLRGFVESGKTVKLSRRPRR